MSTYIRPSVSGGTIFFTVTLARRGSDLLTREIGLLRDAVRRTQAQRPFRIDAWVVLPDHFHCVWALPKGDADFSTRMGAIKARFTMGLRGTGESRRMAGRRPGFSPAMSIPLPTELPVVRSGQYAGLKPGLRQNKRERAIWQRRFWEHHIRDEGDFAAHIRYCHFNPVRHGFVEDPQDWPYSSLHREIKSGGFEPM